MRTGGRGRWGGEDSGRDGAEKGCLGYLQCRGRRAGDEGSVGAGWEDRPSSAAWAGEQVPLGLDFLGGEGVRLRLCRGGGRVSGHCPGLGPVDRWPAGQ